MGLFDPLKRLVGADPAVVAQLERELTTHVAALESERETTRRLQAELEEERARGRRALAVQDAFLSRMSHELRTPLNAVQGYVDLLLEEPPPEAAEDLKKIRLAALNLTALVTSVLDLTQLQSGSYDLRPELLPIDELINQVAESVRITADSQHNDMTVDVEPSLTGELDRRMLESILFNLMSNANKYTKRGTVRVRGRRLRRVTGDQIVIVVADTGIGMTPRQLEEAFRPFSQADESVTRRYDGSGVGLAVVRGFAEAMGGTVTIDSEPGKGATVTIVLPAEVPPKEFDDLDEATAILR